MSPRNITEAVTSKDCQDEVVVRRDGTDRLAYLGMPSISSNDGVDERVESQISEGGVVESVVELPLDTW